MMGLCLWVRWSDYKPSVIYVSVCVSVCVLILVRLEASNQTGHGVGRGERNEWKGRQTEGGTKCIKCTCWGGTHPPGHMYCTCTGRPGCFNNSTGRRSQTPTEINRILHYTKLLIKIFAQIWGSMRNKAGPLRVG